LDRALNVVKSYNLPRKKEQLVIAKLIDALGMNPSELQQAVQKLKRYKIVQREDSTIKLKNLVKERKVINGVNLDDYSNDFQNYIAKKYKGKSISMWKLSTDPMAGTFYWSKPGSEIEVLATPYWDGQEELPIDVQNVNTGDYISQKSYPLKFTADMKKDEESYFKVLKQVLSKVK